MIRSFLNIFLPEDEYKRQRIVYFMAETTFLTVLVLLLFGLFKYILNFNLDTELLLLLGPFIMMAYPFIRYIFSGIEYTDVSNEEEYRKGRQAGAKRSVLVGAIFFVIQFIVKGVPNNNSELIDLIVVPIIFIILYFIVELISLKQSFKKNKQLED